MLKRCFFRFLFLFFVLLLGFSQPVQAITFSTNMDASVAVGQINFINNSTNNSYVNDKGYNFVFGLATDGTHLFVSDDVNARILIYNSIPTTNFAPADVVIGQPDMDSGEDNQGGSPDANTLLSPGYLSTDGTRLFEADESNSRVLIYNHIPTSNNASADVVIGQPDMQSNQDNQGGNVDANTLRDPAGVFYDPVSGKLVVTDNGNSRVLIYNSVPTSNNTPADVVIGQPDMQSNDSNQGGSVDANTLTPSNNARIIQGKLIIADNGNSRVLIYNAIPTTNNQSADVVIGQPDMQSYYNNQGGNPAANTLAGPSDVLWDGSHLLVAEIENNRILVFNGIPTTNNASAIAVIGQPDFTSSIANQGGDAAANTIEDPEGQLAFFGGKLFIGDSGNHRVLIYNSVPTTNNQPADVVVGQPDFNSSGKNGFKVPNSSGLDFPIGVISDGNRLFVADCHNNRLLIYNSIPISNNSSANVVIGQPDMESKQNNQGGSPDANTLSCPEGIATDGTKLFVTDSANNRLLIYNHIPILNNASADVVIGQPDMQSSDSNQGGSVDANTVSCLDGIFYDSPTGKLLITDDCNSRVLIWNSVPTVNNTPADVVIGQPDFTHGDSNQGGNPDANTLNSPVSVIVSSGKLIVSDDSNNRILIWNSVPTVNNTPADVVIGQPDFTSNFVNQGGNPDANTFQQAAGVASDGTRLFATDDINYRVLIFNNIPTSNNASADVVIGQPDMQSNNSNQGGEAGANTLNNPYIGITYVNNKLIVSDAGNNRVLIYDDSLNPTPTPTPTPTPFSGGGGGSSQSNAGPSSSPSCILFPGSAPNLFEIDTKDTSAVLFITPELNADRYIVSYGYTLNDERFQGEFVHKDTSGVIPIKIDHLNPYTNYFFKVKAGNGCAYTAFGNILRANTTQKGSPATNKFYKNLFSPILSFLPKQNTVILKTTPENQPKQQIKPKINAPTFKNSLPKSCLINIFGIKLLCQ